MAHLTHRMLLGGMQAALMLRRHRRLLWGGAEAAGLWGDEPGPSPSPFSPSPDPSPSPLPPPSPPPGPDDPDDPYDLPDNMVIPFILLAFFLVAMAGMMSGLTLGLMSLDQVDIEILRRSGTERQKMLAARIQPVLAHPHVVLVTLLVCNALAAEALPLVLDRLADPATAIIVSVTVVLFFGEIIPQAACSRYGLQIGAYSAPFVKFLIFLTAPISYPIAWVLDRVLGHRQTALFRRAQLKALVDIHKEGQEFGGQLSADEVAIIKGALDLTHKTARNAMTPIDMVFMLPTDAVLDEATLTAIMASGHSRIPVHRPGDRSSILGIMLVKELLMVDKDQGRTVGQMKVRSMPAVRAETPLYDMLKLFEIGRSHMAVLMQLRREAAERQRRQTEEAMMVRVDSMSDDPSMDGSDDSGELSPRPTACLEDFLFDATDFEPVGIITIEDVLEELLQAEILDETDHFVDNLRSMPISAAYLSRTLPPHLRPLLTARALIPRIGGASYMGGTLSMDLEKEPGRVSTLGEKAAAAVVVEGSSPTGTAAEAGAAAAAAAAALAADATATANIQAAADGKRGRQQTKPPLPPLSPRGSGGLPASTAAAAGGRSAAGARRSQSVTGSGARTPPGDGSVRAGLLYRQGSVGAALVAEALRQELAEQLAAAAASARGGLLPRGRSRSLSPLPTRRSADGSRPTSPLPRQGSGQLGAGSSSPAGAAGTAGLELPPSVPLFPGLRRAGSGPASGGASGSSTPRLRAALPPPPPRRSTHVSQRVQEQIDALEPLLSGSSTPARRSSEL